MKKGTLVILSICVFVISLVLSGGIISLNNKYDLDDYFAKICGGDNEDKKCVYIHIEYNPFTYKHTFFYQITHETEINKDTKIIDILKNGQKNDIDGIFEVANNNNSNEWIVLGEDVLVVKDNNDYKKLNKGDRISKDDLLDIVNDLDND